MDIKIFPCKLFILTITLAISNIYAKTLSFNNLRQTHAQLAKLEQSFDGKLGIYAINTANQEVIQYRENERFPFCSTSKVIVVGAMLHKSIKFPNILRTNVKYSQKDLDDSGYHPITEKYLTDGMSVTKLLAAAIEYSDNTAMNLLIRQLGGLRAINAYARSIGDKVFRLDRKEPELNTAIPNDLRDTTTPLAMGKSLQRLVIGNALKPSQRKQLKVLLINNTTGNATIRAGVPKGWIVGDKTGSGGYGTRNDIGIVWPTKKCSPIVMAIYTTQNQKDAQERDDIIVSATKILIDEFAHHDKCLVLRASSG